MKKAFWALLIMALCTGFFLPVKARAAQQPVLSKAEDCLTGEISCYYYNEQGIVVQKVNNGGYREDYNYYSDGVLKSAMQYHQDQPVRFIRYDAFGNVQLEKIWISDGTIRYRNYQNTYDAQGRLLEVRQTDSVDDVLQGRSTLTYVYYENSAAYTTELYEYRTENEDSLYHTRFITYDDAHRLLGDENYYLDGSEESTVLSKLYNDNGILTYEYHTRFYQNSQEIREITYTNKLSKAGLLTQREATTVVTANDQTRTEKVLSKYQYDSAGRVIRIDYFDEAGQDMGFEVWTYDQYGNLLDHSFTGRPLETYEYAPLSQVLWQ